MARASDACSRYESLSLHLFHLLSVFRSKTAANKKKEEEKTSYSKNKGERERERERKRRRKKWWWFFYVLFLSFLFVCPPLVNTSQDKDILLFQWKVSRIDRLSFSSFPSSIFSLLMHITFPFFPTLSSSATHRRIYLTQRFQVIFLSHLIFSFSDYWWRTKFSSAALLTYSELELHLNV